MAVRWRVAMAVLALAAASCNRAGGASAATPSELRSDPRALVELVASIRGLPDSRRTRVLFDDEAAFRRALLRKVERDAIGPTSSDTVEFHLAFDFPSAKAARGSSIAEVIDEQVVAFYDQWTHSVHVRAEALDDTDDDVTAVVAHEIGHSLQTQHFEFPDLAKVRHRDVRLAYNAVLEGDAMLLMLAYVAHENRVPINRALVRAAESVAENAFGSYAKASGRHDALARAPALIRERLVFPYLHGLTFMGALYRAGGYDLVNRVYANPPTSTEQVLHPEKYLAGEKPTPVPAPAAPPGYEALISGRVGELQIRVILSQCMSPDDAARAADGWGGDAFTVAGREGGDAALLWSTVWDDEQHAREFEAAARRYLRCTRSKAGTRVMPLDDVVTRTGTKVALVRGLAASDAPPVVRALLELPEAPPQAIAPFGPVTIPPVRRARAYRAPYVTRGVYVNEQLGLMAAAPRGYSVQMPSATSVTFSRSDPSPAVMGLLLSEQIASTATIDELHGELAGAVQELLGDHELAYLGGRDIYVDRLGRGVERTWAVPNTPAGLRAVVVPICQGAGSFFFWQLWVDDEGRAAVHHWMSTVRPTAWAEPPVCAELNP